jgi:hypothetical protein
MAGTAWPLLVAGQKARASEVTSKFEWIENHLVPMVGGTRTDNTYDLGESSHRWRDIRISRQILLPAGSDTTPSLSHESVATGVFFPTTTAVGFAINGTEVQRCTPNGTRKFANSGFRGTSPYPQTITSAGIVNFSQTTYDVNGDFTTTGVFTAPMNGRYLFTSGVPVESSGITQHRLYLRVDSTIPSANFYVTYGKNNVTEDFLSVQALIDLSVGSTVDCWLTGSTGANMVVGKADFSLRRYFSGYLIG